MDVKDWFGHFLLLGGVTWDMVELPLRSLSSGVSRIAELSFSTKSPESSD
jgi:hypothetical protein